MASLKRLFIDSDGQLSDLFYVAAYVVLVHVFYYKLFVPGQMVFGTDLQNQSYPVQVRVLKDIFTYGYIPEWNPYMNGGMPLLASFSFHPFYPGSLIFFIMPVYFAMGYVFVLHTALMGIFFYYYMRELGLRREPSFVGGLLFCFALHYISLVYPAHGGKIITMTYLPLGLLFLERAFRSDALANFMALGLVVGLMFHGGHPQILFYCGIVLAVNFVFKAAKGWKSNGAKSTARLFGLFAAAFVIGTMLYAMILAPAWQYKGFTHRGGGLTEASDYEFATSFSQPPEDMLYVPLRNPFGWGKDYGPKVPNTDGIFYRGRIGLRLSIDYFCAMGLVLAAIGLLFVRRMHVYMFASVAALTCFLALGGFNPLYRLVYSYVPGFSMFRIPYAIMILLPFCLSGLAAMGLEYLMDKPGAARSEGFLVFLGALGIAAAAAIGVSAYWSSNTASVSTWLLGMEWVRKMLWGMYSDIDVRVLFFAKSLLGFGLLYALAFALLFVYRKGLIKPRHLALAAAIFILADSWSLGWDFIKTVPFNKLDDMYYRKTPAIQAMLDDKEAGGRFRVFALVNERQLMYYGLESATGYHPVILEYFRKLVGTVNLNNPVLGLLDVRYLMTPKEQQYDFRQGPLAGSMELVVEDADSFLYRLKPQPRRAHLVNRLIAVDDQEHALGIVSDPRFVYTSEAVVATQDARRLGIVPGADLSGQKVEYTLFEPDRLEIEVDAPADSLLVASEIWYPGWKAYVDGKETTIVRADYALRGVPVTGGRHKVVMEFTPALFRAGLAISVAALLFVLAVFGRKYYNRRSGAARRV